MLFLFNSFFELEILFTTQIIEEPYFIEMRS
jgi:hypothetical protein